MARGGSVRIEGLRELRRDLKVIDKTLPRELNQRLKKVAEPIRRDAAREAPRSGISRPRYKHLADTLKVGTRGSRVVIYSGKPGARVVHYGGRHPLFGNRERWYSQKPNPFIDRAATKQTGRVERELFDVVDGLMHDAGFH